MKEREMFSLFCSSSVLFDGSLLPNIRGCSATHRLFTCAHFTSFPVAKMYKMSTIRQRTTSSRVAVIRFFLVGMFLL